MPNELPPNEFLGHGFAGQQESSAAEQPEPTAAPAPDQGETPDHEVMMRAIYRLEARIKVLEQAKPVSNDHAGMLAHIHDWATKIGMPVFTPAAPRKPGA